MCAEGKYDDKCYLPTLSSCAESGTSVEEAAFLLEQGADVFAKNKKAAKAKALDQERQQKKLYETIGQLTVERDYLKKSVSSFPHLIDDD